MTKCPSVDYFVHSPCLLHQMENSCGGEEFTKEFLQKFYTFDRTLIVLEQFRNFVILVNLLHFPLSLVNFLLVMRHSFTPQSHLHTNAAGEGKETMEEILLMLNGFLRENDT